MKSANLNWAIKIKGQRIFIWVLLYLKLGVIYLQIITNCSFYPFLVLGILLTRYTLGIREYTGLRPLVLDLIVLVLLDQSPEGYCL